MRSILLAGVALFGLMAAQPAGAVLVVTEPGTYILDATDAPQDVQINFTFPFAFTGERFQDFVFGSPDGWIIDSVTNILRSSSPGGTSTKSGINFSEGGNGI